VWCWRQAEGRQNPENEQSCSASGDGGRSGGQRGARSPKASIPARFRGSEVELAGQIPETSTNARFGDVWCWWQAEGGWNPKTSSRARLRGTGTVVGPERGQIPRKRAFLLGFGVGKWSWQAVGSQIPETSIRARIGDVVLEAGRKRAEPRKRAVMLGVGVRGMVVATRKCQSPENEQNVLVFGVGRLEVSRAHVEDVQKGAKHENAPSSGAFSCSAHAERPVTQKPPKKWVVFVFNLSISVNK